MQSSYVRASAALLSVHTRRSATIIAGLLASLSLWTSAAKPPIEKELTPSVAAPSDTSTKKEESTACKELIHIGDSTSLGLKSKSILPNEEDRIAAKYEAVGVETYYPEISGARSMVETYKDNPNATQVAKLHHKKGYTGCWVLALGTNDSANTKGDPKVLSARIDAMMKLVGDAPALWLTTKSLRGKGPYQNKHMEGWNKALEDACARYPNMRVYDWASEVQDDWFTGDGLHPNSAGYKERSIRIARALARAFPQGNASSTCFIRAD